MITDKCAKEEAKELRAELLSAVQALARYWDGLPIPNGEKLDGVAFSILALIDNQNAEVNSKYLLTVWGRGEPCPINGDLHEYYYGSRKHPDENAAGCIAEIRKKIGRLGNGSTYFAACVVLKTLRSYELFASRQQIELYDIHPSEIVPTGVAE